MQSKLIRAGLVASFAVLFLWWSGLTVISSDHNPTYGFKGTGSLEGDILAHSIPLVCVALAFASAILTGKSSAKILGALAAVAAAGALVFQYLWY